MLRLYGIIHILTWHLCVQLCIYVSRISASNELLTYLFGQKQGFSAVRAKLYSWISRRDLVFGQGHGNSCCILKFNARLKWGFGVSRFPSNNSLLSLLRRLNKKRIAKKSWQYSISWTEILKRKLNYVPGNHFTGGWVGPTPVLDRCGKSHPNRDSISGPSIT
jgi:hypothetical protein